MQIDLNCDMGESFGNFVIGQDEAIMPYISSANIACGFHGGDPSVIQKTVRRANRYKVAIGAHPSYPDLQGFGRREMQLDVQEVYDAVLYQIGAVAAFTRASGVQLQHVKPHGALYNKAAEDPEIASAIATAVFYFDKNLFLFGPPDSCLMDAAKKIGLGFCREAFADRTYTSEGKLTPRQETHALIEDETQAVQQVLSIIQKQELVSRDGLVIPMQADSICIHGDGKKAVAIAKALRKALTENSILVKSFSGS